MKTSASILRIELFLPSLTGIWNGVKHSEINALSVGQCGIYELFLNKLRQTKSKSRFRSPFSPCRVSAPSTHYVNEFRFLGIAGRSFRLISVTCECRGCPAKHVRFGRLDLTCNPQTAVHPRPPRLAPFSPLPCMYSTLPYHITTRTDRVRSPTTFSLRP